MMITLNTTISFSIPEDAEMEKEFRRTHDLSEWMEFPTTVGSTYVHKKTFFTTHTRRTEHEWNG